MDDSAGLPDVCDACGAVDAYRRRYVTGGGWRPVYRCAECGHRYRPGTDRSDPG